MRYVTVVLELDNDDTTSHDDIMESLPWCVSDIREGWE